MSSRQPATPSRPRRRRPVGRRLRGFTMAEMAAVIAIILLLSSISVAVFINTRATGDDTAAGQSLVEAELTQRFWFKDNGVFLRNVIDLEEATGNDYTFTAHNIDSPDSSVVSVASADPSAYVAMATRSESGNCLILIINGSGGRISGTQTDTFAIVDDPDADYFNHCNGATASELAIDPDPENTGRVPEPWRR